MSKILLKIHNFKQYDTKDFDGEGSLIAFVGANGTGKSTAIQAIEESLMAKNFVKSPIKTGEKEANILFKYVREGQEPIQITTTIEGDNQYSFNAAYIGKEGKIKSINDPKKIRELVGNYYPLTVENVLNDVKYAEGRRNFINNYLLPLLGEEKKNRLQTLQLSISDKKNKSTEGNLYYSRREAQEALRDIENQIKGNTLTEEEKTVIASKKVVVDALDKLKGEKEFHKDDSIVRMKLEEEIENLSENYEQLINFIVRLENNYLLSLPEKDSIYTKITDLITSKELEKDKLYLSLTIDALNEKITRGNNKLTEITLLEKKTTNTELIKQRDKLFDEITNLEDKISMTKIEIKNIFSNSLLPAGLEISEEEIILNGLVLDETTNSNTEVRLAIIELLTKLNTSGFINLGDFSLYSEDSRKKLLNLAKTNNMMFMGQLVSEDKETILQTIIIDK